MKHLLAFLFASLAAVPVRAQQTQFKDIHIGATVDAVLPTSFDESSNNRALLRGAELALYGPIDHLFDGAVFIGSDEEDGEIKLAIEEAFLSTSKLIPQSRLRAGKFLLNIGRLNTYHQHDWPFITAPRMFREFISPGATALVAEGAKDAGLEYTWLVPVDRFFEITLGAVNGYCWGGCATPNQRPPHPTFYIHPSTFFEFGTGKGLLLGATYLKRSDATKLTTDLMGIDVTFKQREGKTLKWLVQSEVYYQEQNQRATSTQRAGGVYVFPEYGLDAQWSIGLRGDYYKQMKSNGEKTWAAVPAITLRPSEFSTWRLAYSHEITDRTGDDLKDRQIQLQFTYHLGAHPAHDF
jgi:hypothetical protein